MAQKLEIVFTTKGVKNLLTHLNQISKGFGALNQATSANAVNKFALEFTRGATLLEKTAKHLKSAAQELHAATKAAGAITGGPGNKRTPKQKTFWQKLSDVFTTSRIGFGGKGGMNFAPLVGRLLKILPPQAQAVAAVAGAIITAGAAIYTLAHQAAGAAREFQHLKDELGSSSGTTATLANLGRGAGTDLGGLASSFQSRITGDTTARAFAASMGLYNISGPFGNQDYGKQLLDAIEGLRAITDPSQRIRTARALGLEGALPLTELSNRQYSKVKGDQGVASRIFDAKFTQESADFFSSVGRVSTAVQNLLAALGKPFMNRLTDFMNGVADGVNALADFLNSHEGILNGISKVMSGIFAMSHGDTTGGVRAFKEAYDAFSGKDIDKALHANTEATERNTQATLRLEGTFGRGARLGGAIPAGVGGEYLRRGLEAGGFNFSGF